MSNEKEKGNQHMVEFDQIDQSAQVDKLKINEEDDNQEQDDRFVYDKIIEEYGYGPEVWKIMISTSLITYFSGFFTHYFSVLALLYLKIFDLSMDHMAFLPLVFYISKGLGCLFISNLSRIISRIKIVRIGILILICNMFIQFVSKNYYIFLFMRLYEGFICGSIENIAINVFIEYLPIKNRSLVFNCVWNGYNLSQTILIVLGFFIMPKLDTSKMNYIFIFQAPFLFVFYVVILVYFKEGPRTNILQKMEEKAFEYLYKLNNEELFTEKIKCQIIKHIYDEEYYTDSSFFKKWGKLFGKKYLLATFIFIYCCTSSTILSDGVTAIQSLLNYSQNINSSMWKSLLIINLIGLISPIFFGFISEFQYLGRIKSISIGFILLTLSCLLFFIIPAQTELIYSLLGFFSSVNILIYEYSAEFFPTKIRDFANGQVSCIAYILNGFAVFLFFHLLSTHKIFIFIILFGLSLSSSLIIFLSPYDTYGSALDSYKVKRSNDSDENLKLVSK